MTTEITEMLDATLAHFGVVGMKWGKVKGPVSASGYPGNGFIRVEGGGNLTNKQAGALAKIAHDTQLTTTNVSPKFHSDIAAINSRYDKTKFSKDISSDPQQQKYRSECRRVYEKHVAERLPEGLHVKVMEAQDPSKPAYVVIGNKAGIALETGLLSKEGFKHSEASSNAKRFMLHEEVDASGLVVDMYLGKEMQHSDFLDDLDATLAHFGIPGMKWGQRKSRGSSVDVSAGPQSVTVKTKMDGKNILETSGGRGHLPSEDAVNSAALRQKARASGTHSLSNQELQTLVTRMNLESNYQKAVTAGKVPKQKNLLEKFMEGEKNMLISGKKPKTAKLVEAIIAASAGAKYAAKHKK